MVVDSASGAIGVGREDREVTPRWREWIPAAVLAAASLRALSAMLIPALRQPGTLDVVLLVVALAGAIGLAATGPVSRWRWAAAAAAAFFWMAPVVSGLIHGQELSITTTAMAAVAVALIIGPPHADAAFRLAILVGGVVVVLSIAYGLVSAMGLLDGAFHSVGSYQRSVFGIRALRGIALHPNSLGQIVAITLLLSMSLALVRRRQWVAWLLPGFCIVALLWTESRSSLGAAATAVAAYAVVTRWESTRAFIVAGACLAVAAPIIAFITIGQWVDLTGVLMGRGWAWFVGAAMFREAPLTGYGPDAFSPQYWDLWTPGQAPWEPLHAHNELLESAAQAGLIGVAALLAVGAAAVVPALRRAGSAGHLTVAVVVLVGVLAGFEVVLGLTYFPASYLFPTLVVTAIAYAGRDGAVFSAQSQTTGGSSRGDQSDG